MGESAVAISVGLFLLRMADRLCGVPVLDCAVVFASAALGLLVGGILDADWVAVEVTALLVAEYAAIDEGAL